MNQKSIIAILGVVVVILISTTVYFATINKASQSVVPAPKVAEQPVSTPAPVSQQPTSTQTDKAAPAAPANEPNSLKVYANTEYGFEFAYPVAWKMVTTSQASSVDYLPGSRNFVAIYPDSYPAQDFSARVDVYNASIATVKRDNPFIKNLSSSIQTINGISWVKMGNTDYLTEKNGKTYDISGRGDLISQIVSTFKFTK